MTDAEISTARRVAVGLTAGLAYISWGLLISLQPAFYPTEAEAVGATPSQVLFPSVVIYHNCTNRPN